MILIIYRYLSKEMIKQLLGSLPLLLTIALFLALCLAKQQNKQDLNRSPDIVDDLIKKLFRVCEEKESISLWECEPKLIANDKKIGNYRDNFNYTRETIYMMGTFDLNHDGRLNYRELYHMGEQIMEGNAADYKIGKKVQELEESGWVAQQMRKVKGEFKGEGSVYNQREDKTFQKKGKKLDQQKNSVIDESVKHQGSKPSQGFEQL